VRSVVITGANGIFSAGGNLQRLQNNRQLPPEHQAQSIEGLHNWIEAIRTFPKPVIAAVEGPAAGAGFSLALACDMIVAARNSLFVMAYSSIALSPDGGGSWSLSRAVPRQLATELLMCGERIGAERLHQLGVVNRLADAGHALQQALELSEQLNAGRRRWQQLDRTTGPRTRPLRQKPAPPQRRHWHWCVFEQAKT
jgi:enoyl-CoA hydratase/carnithine racemase